MEKKAYIILLGFLAVLGLVLSGCNKSDITGKAIKDSDITDLRHLVLEIHGLYCPSCGPGIAKMFSEVDGVRLAKVSRAKEKAELIYDPNKVTKEELVGMLHDPYNGKILADMPASKETIEIVDKQTND